MFTIRRGEAYQESCFGGSMSKKLFSRLLELRRELGEMRFRALSISIRSLTKQIKQVLIHNSDELYITNLDRKSGIGSMKTYCMVLDQNVIEIFVRSIFKKTHFKLDFNTFEFYQDDQLKPIIRVDDMFIRMQSILSDLEGGRASVYIG